MWPWARPQRILPATLWCWLAISLWLTLQPAYASTKRVDNSEQLRQALQHAEVGDNIHLNAGQYIGQFEITQAVSLSADKQAVIDAQGQGSALRVSSPNVIINGLTIRNWGRDLYQQDAAVHLAKGADQVQVKNCQLYGPGFGIFAVDIEQPLLSHNQIIGERQLYTLDRGDGIHLLRVNQARVEHNQISWVRDGVYLESGIDSQVNHNRFSDQQYGIHYMYTKADSAKANHAVDVDGGYALMNAYGIKLTDNFVRGAREFGVLLNLTNDATIANNVIVDTYDPNASGELLDEGKGIFIYGARGNLINANTIGNNQVGLSMAMGGESNVIYENQFIDNQIQVKYIGDVCVEWSHQGRGNYWSDYQGWDLTGNGIGESLHLPNDSLDRLFWLYPEARFLMDSPVVKLLKWLDNQVQQAAPKGVTDSYPILAPALVPQIAHLGREE
ncbi:nitrous oxide reductase family maturation protein NosD [Shewanella waksmanii]|uniref:nitrous oxide reductase family maturation protein NosD n=1 Tax=Shewanella waksmanii TaxID=213783 RepID=UPI0004B01482|nr:nitrous oxide reductase family maturation protein NosD [Shewanella waksmanii]